MLKLFQGARPLTRERVFNDGLAGVALAALTIPQALGYARIAGMPVVTGLYTLLLPLVAFAVFGSSRYLVVAADSATAAILAGGLATMATAGSQQYVAMAGLVAALTACFLLLGRVLRLGFISDFLSQTVLLGFLTGVGVQVGIGVLGEMLGIQVHSRRTILQMFEICHQLHRMQLPTLLLSATVLCFVVALRRAMPKIPGPLLAVVCATTASVIWNFAGKGITTIGPIAAGLPHLHRARVHWNDVPPLVGIAGSCAVMILTQSAATARVYAVRHDERPNANQDLIGLFAANLASALSGSFVVNGSPTQTAMVESVGSQSQIAQFGTALVVGLVLLFATRFLQYLPECVLGALVLLVASRLINLRGLRAIRRESPGEYALAVFAAVTVVGIGVEQGILLAMVISLLRIVKHSYLPHSGIVIIGQDGAWKVVPVSEKTETPPGLVLYRFGAALFYANAGRFADEVLSLTQLEPVPIHWIIVDAEAITDVDYSAARVVLELGQSLAKVGVELGFARLGSETKADFDRHGLTEAIGPSRLFPRIHDALNAYGSEGP